MKGLVLMLPLVPVGSATAYNPPEGVGQGMNFTMIFLIAYTAVWLLVLFTQLTRRHATPGRRESSGEKKLSCTRLDPIPRRRAIARRSIAVGPPHSQSRLDARLGLIPQAATDVRGSNDFSKSRRTTDKTR
jgi:hypothetical protein